MARELAMGDVHPHLDVAEEAATAPQGLPVEGVLEPLDLLVIGGHSAAQQAPRRGQALEEVHLRISMGSKEAARGERPGGPCPNDRDVRPLVCAHAAVRSEVLRSVKKSELRSCA